MRKARHLLLLPGTGTNCSLKILVVSEALLQQQFEFQGRPFEATGCLKMERSNSMQDRQPESWPRLLLKKWLSFKETVDDFDRDTFPNAEEFSESEEFDDSDDSQHKNPLLRAPSEILRERFVVNNEYKIAVGTWNVGGLLPPDDVDLDGFLDASDPADIYVLGFQEIVPLSYSNVLCVEDDSPTVTWDGLIRQALNTRVKCCERRPHSSRTIPAAAWSESDVPKVADVPEVSDVHGLVSTIVSEDALESSLLHHHKVNPPSSDNGQWTRLSDQTVKELTKKVKTAEDWLCEANMPDDDGVTVEETPLLNDKHSCSQYCRVASRQMVGIFISVWVRSDLRRYVSNVKVSVVGCGILNFLRNKGAVSVSMSLHQTSFCFVCTHLTSGHKEGDERRRNADVADVLRRSSFPRLVKLSGMQLPETIMAHDRIIWLGDLNYRIDLPDDETWALVNQSDWKTLLPKDQLKVERDAGRVFQGWHECAINFPPTYKFVVESDEYFGENTFKGDKRRTPAWCDRILFHGRGLRQLSYLMVEAKLSDHRPVIARFSADVESVSGRKLRRACNLSNDAKVDVEELLLRPVLNFKSEDIEHPRRVNF